MYKNVTSKSSKEIFQKINASEQILSLLRRCYLNHGVTPLLARRTAKRIWLAELHLCPRFLPGEAASSRRAGFGPDVTCHLQWCLSCSPLFSYQILCPNTWNLFPELACSIWNKITPCVDIAGPKKQTAIRPPWPETQCIQPVYCSWVGEKNL